MRRRKNDVVRDGWSAHKLAEEASYRIDTKQKLKQGDVGGDVKPTHRNDKTGKMHPRTSPSEKEVSPKQSSTTRRVR